MTRNLRQRESGQAILLLALALVGMLGFAALAIDGGNIYAEQRRAQAAADSAALAAAYAYSQNKPPVGIYSGPENAARDRARSNGYDNGVGGATVLYYNPPDSGPYFGQNQYFKVTITMVVKTALAHLVYRGPWQVTVSAIAYGVRADPLMNGYAIATMDPHACSSLVGNGGGASGGTETYIGGVWVNSDCAPPSGGALVLNGHDAITTNGSPPPPINVVGSVDYHGGGSSNPTATTGVTPVTQDPIAGTEAATPPSCDHTQVGGTLTGVLAPGVWCISGGASVSAVTGTEVLLYFSDLTSNFSDNNEVDTLSAPTAETCATYPSTCHYTNIVIYKPQGACDDGFINNQGNKTTQLTLTGLLYAPFSQVSFAGNGSFSITGQAIIGCGDFSGNGSIVAHYDPNHTFRPAPAVSDIQ